MERPLSSLPPFDEYLKSPSNHGAECRETGQSGRRRAQRVALREHDRFSIVLQVQQ